MHVVRDDRPGGECILNRLAAEADLLLAQGFIEPHLFAGFSGGRKSVLPGISSYKTIMANHCAEFINSPEFAVMSQSNGLRQDPCGLFVGLSTVDLHTS